MTTALCSKAATASAQVKATPGLLYGVVITAGADAASVTIYNNTAGSGTKLVVLKAAIGTTVSWTPSQPVAANKGLYATITGTTPDVNVYFG